ncbi:hypothetical protein AB0J35_24955 [Nonomuraea angiospora]|uniref:hypothetical protein n=1 Tax=Nonomuraea angiospora TaxID=46172 RepID=UPI0034202754
MNGNDRTGIRGLRRIVVGAVTLAVCVMLAIAGPAAADSDGGFGGFGGGSGGGGGATGSW